MGFWIRSKSNPFLDISKNDQQVIFSLISAILHLGNVRIVNEKPNESSTVNVSLTSLILIQRSFVYSCFWLF